ncbi:hypothetical protein ACFIQF_15385 [Comamonas sp. J-3]
MNDLNSQFAKLQAEDTRNERRLAWAELLVLVTLVLAAIGIAWLLNR